jgi:hypothetical protein
MTHVYYRQHGTVVTDRQFVSDGYRYEIADLAGLVQARGSLHPGAMVGMVIAFGEAVVLFMLAGTLRTPLAWLLAAFALLIPCVASLVCARRWPPRHELRAHYRGQEVTIFTTRDEREFGQVGRAMVRATEAFDSN